MENFLALRREIRKHWIYQDSEYFHIWTEMLFCARYSVDPNMELMEGELVEVQYGEFLFGRKSWSERLRVGEQRLRTLIKRLIKEEMIELVSQHRKCSKYRIVNYAKFNQQTNHQNDQSYQGFDGYANHQTNQRLTTSQPPANHQLTTKEESSNTDNNDKKERKSKSYTPEFDEFWNLYPRKIGKLEAFKTWEKVLKKGESSNTIIQCAANYSQDCINKQTEEQFIKHPKTFLNDERYKDYKVIVISQNKPSSGNVWDRMEEEARRNGSTGYYQTGTDLFS